MASPSSSWPESTTTGTLGECSRTRRKVSAPRLSGRFKSSRTTEGVSLVRESSPSDNRLTQLTFTGDLPSIKRRRTRSASPGLSSISNTLVVWESITVLSSLSWQAYCAEPEFFNRLHRGKKLIQIARLSDVTVRAHFVAAHNIAVQLRGGKDRDRNAPQLGPRFHRRQHRQAAFLGEIQVQNHQVGPDRVYVFVPVIQISHRFHSVLDAMDLGAMGASRQRLAGQNHIGR